MESSIIALIFAIIMIISHIIKSIRENAEAVQQQKPDITEDELVITRPKNPIKQQKPNPQRLTERQPLTENRSVSDNTNAGLPKQKALIKKLSPQGEGQRFAVDPGTLNTASIVAPTIDPTVKPELNSITGIYEQDAAAMATRRSLPTIELNIVDYLARPESLCQAMILAEILNRPAWNRTDMPQYTVNG